MGKKKKKHTEVFSFEDFENGLVCKTSMLTIDQPFVRQECGEKLYKLSEEIYPQMDVLTRQKTIGMILEKWEQKSLDLIDNRDLFSNEITKAEQCFICHRDKMEHGLG